MPTLIHVEGFEHRSWRDENDGQPNSFVFDNMNRDVGITADTGVKRTGAASLKLVEDGVTATWAQIGFVSVTQILVGSVYLRMAAAPSVESRIIRHPGPSQSLKFAVTTAGEIAVQFDTTTPVGPVITDGNWHRLDWRIVTDGVSHTVTWAVDGSSQTPRTFTAAGAENMTDLEFGSTNLAHTATVWYDDLVLSVTDGDYPLGAHSVHALVPDSDGSHNNPSSSLQDHNGTTIGTAWSLLDEWPPTSATDLVKQTTIQTAHYAEVNFPSPGVVPWAVVAVAALQNPDSTVSNGTTRIVDAGGATLVDVYSGDHGLSNTQIHTARKLVPDPGGNGWSSQDLDGLKARIGFSSDATPNPGWLALMLQYAVSDTPPPIINRRLRTVSSPLRW